jgi:hypothetical protein
MNGSRSSTARGHREHRFINAWREFQRLMRDPGMPYADIPFEPLKRA